MRGKAGGWIMFVGCLFLLSFAATSRYSKTADLALISVRVTLLLLLSVLVLRERWQHRQRSQSGEVYPNKSDANVTVLQRWRRWFYDEQKSPN